MSTERRPPRGLAELGLVFETAMRYSALAPCPAASYLHSTLLSALEHADAIAGSKPELELAGLNS